MLDRVVSEKKEKVQFYLAPETIKAIFDRAASFSPRKTQSKFITDLVESAVRVEKLDVEGLRNIIRRVGVEGALGIGADGALLGEDGAISAILSIFGIEEVSL